MIRYVSQLLARSLMDAAIVLVVVATLLGLTAWRIVRRLVSEQDSGLERKSQLLLEAASMLSRIRS